MKFWGSLYIVVAVLAGYSSFVDMMAGVNGSPQSVRLPIVLGAAILLLVDGIKMCFPSLRDIWLVSIVGAIPLAICSAFGEWPARCWVFSAMLAFSEFVFLRASKAIKRDGISAFICSVVLVTALAATTVNLFLLYWRGWWDATSRWTLTDIVGFMLPALIPWSILLPILVHATKVVFRHQRVFGDQAILES